MALNQQQQYFSAYSQVNSEISNKNDFPQETSRRKITSFMFRKNQEKEVKLITVNKQSSEIEKSFISDAKIYALKKRLLLPLWLLEGVLLVLGTKEPWFESIACARLGKIFACPTRINVKTLIPFFLIWHELVSRIFNLNSKETTVKLQINKFITGTKKDVQDIAKEIENIFSSPLKLFEIKTSKKTKLLTMSKKGSLNFIRHAQLEYDVDGVWMTLSLSNSFKEICYPPELKSSLLNGSDNIVSISPTVIQSMGSRANLKKILNYLFLEFSKQQSYSNNSNWNSFRIDCKKISHFHKDFLSTAPALYDHGVLGWNNCAPHKKISELKEQSKTPHQKHEIICSWQLSDQIKEAYEIEHAISEKIMQHQPKTYEYNSQSLFPEPPEDQLKKIREDRKIKKINLEKEREIKQRNLERKSILSPKSTGEKPAKSKIITQTLFDDGLILKKKPIPTPSPQDNRFIHDKPKSYKNLTQNQEMSDTEFLVMVSEFYESLKPMQKKAFERERKGMSGEQFRAYMSSILGRKKTAPL